MFQKAHDLSLKKITNTVLYSQYILRYDKKTKWIKDEIQITYYVPNSTVSTENRIF